MDILGTRIAIKPNMVNQKQLWSEKEKISICYFEESSPHVFVISARSENVKWQNVFLNTGNHEWRIPHKIFMIKLVLDAVMQFNHPEEFIFLPLVTLVFKYLLASTLQLH